MRLPYDTQIYVDWNKHKQEKCPMCLPALQNNQKAAHKLNFAMLVFHFCPTWRNRWAKYLGIPSAVTDEEDKPDTVKTQRDLEKMLADAYRVQQGKTAA